MALIVRTIFLFLVVFNSSAFAEGDNPALLEEKLRANGDNNIRAKDIKDGNVYSENEVAEEAVVDAFAAEDLSKYEVKENDYSAPAFSSGENEKLSKDSFGGPAVKVEEVSDIKIEDKIAKIKEEIENNKSATSPKNPSFFQPDVCRGTIEECLKKSALERKTEIVNEISPKATDESTVENAFDTSNEEKQLLNEANNQISDEQAIRAIASEPQDKDIVATEMDAPKPQQIEVISDQGLAERMQEVSEEIKQNKENEEEKLRNPANFK